MALMLLFSLFLNVNVCMVLGQSTVHNTGFIEIKDASSIISQIHYLQTQSHRQQLLLERIKKLLENQQREGTTPGKPPGAYMRNCVDILQAGHRQSGEYTVVPFVDAYGPAFVKVYCDMETDGGGWLVFQRRKDGSVNFYETWANYAQGFGALSGEFWLGNKYLHYLTSQDVQELRIDMRNGTNTSRHATYKNFHVGPADSKFLLSVSDYEGNAGDSFLDHNGMKFSTKDQDNDMHTTSCAEAYKGGWWYSSCHFSNLNGLYHNGPHESNADGIEWYTWHGLQYSLQFTEMKIRPHTFH